MIMAPQVTKKNDNGSVGYQKIMIMAMQDTKKDDYVTVEYQKR